jgi:WD40 repeat protein
MPNTLAVSERTLGGHTQLVSGVAFSPDGRNLASVSQDRTLKVWALSGGAPERTLFCGRQLSGVAFSPDGRTVACTAVTGELFLWCASDWRLLAGQVVDVDEIGGITPVAFSPDGRTLLCGGSGSIRAFDALGRERFALGGDDLLGGTVGSLAFSPSGATAVSAVVETGAIVVWEARSWQPKRTLFSRPTEYQGRTFGSKIWSVAYAPGGTVIASAGDDRVVTLWDAETGRPLRTCVGHEYTLFSGTVSPDAEWIASASSDQTVRVWDYETCAELATMPADPDGDGHGAYQVAFSPTGPLLAAACSDTRIRLWAW